MVDTGDLALDASYEDWQLVGSSYFSRRELYSLPWGRTHRGGPGVNLEYMRCALTFYLIVIFNAHALHTVNN